MLVNGTKDKEERGSMELSSSKDSRRKSHCFEASRYFGLARLKLGVNLSHQETPWFYLGSAEFVLHTSG